jgi:Mn-dependent DtxR family transcriptional regulator
MTFVTRPTLSSLSPSLEKYLKAIYDLQTEKGYTRVTDIAKALRVAKPAVSAAFKNLGLVGLIHHRAYEGVRLTEEGIQKAKGISGKFSILSQFFSEVLGVDKRKALEDAGLMEHYASGDTMDRLVDLLRFFEAEEQKGILEAFQEFRRECESEDTCVECDFHCEIVTQEPSESPEKKFTDRFLAK